MSDGGAAPTPRFRGCPFVIIPIRVINLYLCSSYSCNQFVVPVVSLIVHVSPALSCITTSELVSSASSRRLMRSELVALAVLRYRLIYIVIYIICRCDHHYLRYAVCYGQKHGFVGLCKLISVSIRDYFFSCCSQRDETIHLLARQVHHPSTTVFLVRFRGG